MLSTLSLRSAASPASLCPSLFHSNLIKNAPPSSGSPAACCSSQCSLESEPTTLSLFHFVGRGWWVRTKASHHFEERSQAARSKTEKTGR